MKKHQRKNPPKRITKKARKASRFWNSIRNRGSTGEAEAKIAQMKQSNVVMAAGRALMSKGSGRGG